MTDEEVAAVLELMENLQFKAVTTAEKQKAVALVAALEKMLRIAGEVRSLRTRVRKKDRELEELRLMAADKIDVVKRLKYELRRERHKTAQARRRLRELKEKI